MATLDQSVRATLKAFLLPPASPPRLNQADEGLRQAFIREGLWGMLCQQQNWRPEYMLEMGRQGRWLDLLHELDQELAKRNASAVVFKGGSAISGLYPGLALRPLSDLDLWVDEHAAHVFAELGFQTVSARPHVMARGQFRLDLHQHPLGRQGQVFAWNLSRARAAAIPLGAHGGLYRFQAEDETLVALLHAGKHGYSRMIWLADLALLLQRCRPEQLRAILKEAEAGRYLHYARWMLREESGLHAADWAGSIRINPFERWFLEGCLRRRPSSRAGMLLPLLSLRSPRRAARYLWSALRPKADQSLWQRWTELWQPAP